MKLAAIQDFVEKIVLFFRKDEQTLDASVLKPASWRERQVQNQAIEKQYEESVKAKTKTAHWSDRYDKDFENIKKEVVRVRYNGE